MSHGAAPIHERIVLVGFMASGKSAVGRRLAERIGWDFVDFDDEIADRTGRSAASWIREEGEASLRRLEDSLTDEMMGRTRIVLAPGGGWAARPESARRLGPGTVRIWLRVTAAEAVRRARRDPVDRPLLGNGPDADRAEALLREREPYYATAELAVDTGNVDQDTVVEEIVRRLGFPTGG